ncbi:MAG: hypothetical protein KGJ95_06510 [Candidatus Omnitrophica bacterium]|nr:hypothetical protein [Candidatus Omnitrophota bacterium]
MCPIGEVPYNGACCIASCAGKCTGGSDGCGGTCTNNCPSGEACDSGICSALSPQFYVAANSCSSATNTTKVLCYSPAAYVTYNNESFTYCSSTPAIYPGMVLVSSVAATPGIPAVINGGCGDATHNYGEPGTSCQAAWPTCQDGNVNVTTDNSATRNVSLVVSAGTPVNLACPTNYITDASGTSSATLTCQSDGTWSSSALCMPYCTSADVCTSSCSGAACNSPTICNAGASNQCWYTPVVACPAGYEYTAGCPLGEYAPGGSCPSGTMCTTGGTCT